MSDIKDELNSIGFSFDFEEENIEINSIPSCCMNSNLQEIFDEILNDNEIESDNINLKIENKLYMSLSKTICIKKGDKLMGQEMKSLVEKLIKCETSSVCPNGLPTYFNLEKKEIEKRFKRWI